MRELENIIERSVALATRTVSRIEDLPFDLALLEKLPGKSDREASTLSL